MNHVLLQLNADRTGLYKDTTIPQPPLYVPKSNGKLLATVDWRKWFGPIYDQSILGSCTAFSGTSWYSGWQVKHGLPWHEYSEEADYYEERVEENTVNQDSGASMLDEVTVLTTKGVMPEAVFPYITQNWRVKPPEQDFTNPLPVALVKTIDPNNRLAHTLDALSNGYPVLFGFICFNGILSQETAQTGILSMPSSGEQPQGGHAVVAVGYDESRKMLLIRNSWGASWGQNGYFWMPYTYYAAYCDDAYIIEDDVPVPMPQPSPHPPKPKPTPAPSQFMLHVGPVDESDANDIIAYCTTKHVGVVRHKL